jgi:glucosamine--fructose-6-phosphate aminotransferase (isomerizing)
VATLTAVAWTAAVLGGNDPSETVAALDRAIPAMQRYLAKWREHVQFLSVELDGIDDVFVTGRGASLAAAGTGGLILKESTHLHAEGMSSAAFRHGPFEMLSARVFVLVFEGIGAAAALNRALVKDIRGAGGRAALVSDNAALDVFRLPAVPETAGPLVEILPVQMMSLVLAAQRGHEPGRFRLATKITTVE